MQAGASVRRTLPEQTILATAVGTDDFANGSNTQTCVVGGSIGCPNPLVGSLASSVLPMDEN